MRRLATDSIALLIYAALVVWLTWPLGAHLATHLPNAAVESRFDGLLVTWALAHESRALASDPARLGEANIYFPARHALFYAEAGFGALPYFVGPFLLTDNPALAMNLTLLLSVALSAWALPLAVIAGGRLLGSATRAAGARLLAVLGLSAFAVILAYCGYLVVRLENPALQAQSPWPYPATVPSFDYGLRLPFLRTLVVPAT